MSNQNPKKDDLKKISGGGGMVSDQDLNDGGTAPTGQADKKEGWGVCGTPNTKVQGLVDLTGVSAGGGMVTDQDLSSDGGLTGFNKPDPKPIDKPKIG